MCTSTVVFTVKPQVAILGPGQFDHFSAANPLENGVD